MPATKKSTSRRKVAAIALAVVGGLGLSFASAAQLNLTAPTSVQAGAVDVAADCQPTASTIGVTFATPSLSGGNYVSNAVTFSNIHTSCYTRTYRVAFLGTSNNLLGSEVTAAVPSASSFSVNLPSGVSQNSVVRIALAIY